jgi:hypothetical protein
MRHLLAGAWEFLGILSEIEMLRQLRHQNGHLGKEIGCKMAADCPFCYGPLALHSLLPATAARSAARRLCLGRMEGKVPYSFQGDNHHKAGFEELMAYNQIVPGEVESGRGCRSLNPLRGDCTHGLRD